MFWVVLYVGMHVLYFIVKKSIDAFYWFFE